MEEFETSPGLSVNTTTDVDPPVLSGDYSLIGDDTSTDVADPIMSGNGSVMGPMTAQFGEQTEVPPATQPTTLNVFRFPENIGTPTPGVVTSSYANSGTGHYMMIFANVQRRTQYPFTADPVNSPTRVENANRFAGSSSATYDISYLLSNINNTIRTTEAFVLQIPDTVAYNNSQSYDEFGIGGTPLAAGLTGAQSYQDLMRSRNDSKDAFAGAARNLAPSLLALASKGLPGGQAIFQNLTGLAINPMMEVIYTKPNFRHFRFDFLLYPRSKSESRSLQDLIRRMRFHHAPEIFKESKGFFLVPPSTFDIKFYYNGQENINIDPISTCVLTDIDVDYAPQGWSAYEELNNDSVSLGGTGMPVGLRLTLQFKETEYMTKDHYKGTGDTAAADVANGVAPIG
jgi:hypothetical protein